MLVYCEKGPECPGAGIFSIAIAACTFHIVCRVRRAIECPANMRSSIDRRHSANCQAHTM